MYPSVPAILITPICAHSLSFRPLVLPDAAVLTCAVPLECRSSGWVSFDGKFRCDVVLQVAECGTGINTNIGSAGKNWNEETSWKSGVAFTPCQL